MKKKIIFFVVFVIVHFGVTVASMSGAQRSTAERIRAGETELRPTGRMMLYLGNFLFEPTRSIVKEYFSDKDYSEKIMYQFLAAVLINSLFWGFIIFSCLFCIKRMRPKAT